MSNLSPIKLDISQEQWTVWDIELNTKRGIPHLKATMYYFVSILIIYMKKILHSDWLRAVQF